jgi:serine/threonine protein kinase
MCAPMHPADTLPCPPACPSQVLRLPSSELVMNGTIRPEDIPGVNEKVDIWSLGVTIFELVTGRSPFDGSNKEEIKANIIHHKMRAFPSFISKDCADFIMQVGQPDRQAGGCGAEAACAVFAALAQRPAIRPQHSPACGNREPCCTAPVAASGACCSQGLASIW